MVAPSKPDAVTVLASAATHMAIRGAAAYVRAHKITPTEAQAPALEEAIKRELDAALPVALDDAREAVEARMESLAVATFATSMRLAGIRAAASVYPI